MAVKAIQRAKIQQNMDQDELDARIAFHIPLELSNAEVMDMIQERIKTVDWLELARNVFGFNNNLSQKELIQNVNHLKIMGQGLVKQDSNLTSSDPDSSGVAAVKAGERDVLYRFYSMLNFYSNADPDKPQAATSLDDTDRKIAKTTRDAKKPDRKIPPRRSSKPVEELGSISDLEDDDYNYDDCEDGCSNPDCENYTVESDPNLRVATYSILIESGLYEVSAFQPDKFSLEMADLFGDDLPTFTPRPGSKHVDYSYFLQNVRYGRSGHFMHIFKTITDFQEGIVPQFMEHFNTSMKTYKGFEMDDRIFKTPDAPLSVPEELRKSYREKLGLGKTPNPLPIDVLRNGSDGYTALLPAKLGNYVMVIPFLDFVKPILRDRYVCLNNVRIPARLMYTGTEINPSFSKGIRDILLGQKIPKPLSLELPSSFIKWSERSIATKVPRNVDTNTTPSPKSISSSRPDNMLVALQASLALELQSGFMNRNIDTIHDMILEGQRSLNRKEAKANGGYV